MNDVDFVLKVNSFEPETGRLEAYVHTDQRFPFGALIQYVGSGLLLCNARKFFPKRGIRANRKFHAVIYQICKDTREDFERVKEWVKMRAITFGVFEEYKGTFLPKSESKCDSREEGILIDIAVELAQDLGVKLKEDA